MDIGKKIRQLRLQNNLTLEDLASRSELTKGFLSQLERDLTSPSISTLEDILEALGTNLSEFFHEEEEEQIVFTNKDFFVHTQDEYQIEWIVRNYDLDNKADITEEILADFNKKLEEKKRGTR